MKKQFLWMLAAILMLSGTAMLLTACVDKHDNPAGDPDTIENYVLPEPEQTDDDLKVTIKEKTYVFDGNYTAEGKALVARAACTTTLTVGEQMLPNEEIANLV